jgi:hypothetical protein
MTGPMHADAGARALDALPPAEAAAFDEHVAGCDSCAVEYAEFLATAAMLAAAVAEPPPDGLREKVLRAAARTPQLPPLTATTEPSVGEPVEAPDPLGRHRRHAPWWRRPVLLVAAAVAAALIAGGVVVATHRGGTSPEQAAAQCVAAAPDARVHHPSVGSAGSVTLARSCDAAVVRLAALPGLPAGKAYQLWLLVGDSARSAGMVAARTGPSGRIILTDLSASDTGVAVSVEPAGGSTAPTTTPVWVVPLGS